MKQRVLSIEVVKDSVIQFQKEVASPQDLMAALQLFEGDDVTFTVKCKEIDLPIQGNK